VLAARAQSDLLELWRSCRKKFCRRAHACLGDERCRLRPFEADLNNPNLGRPDFQFNYRRPEALRKPSAILDQLPFLPEPPTPEAILQDCTAGAPAQTPLRRIFRLHRRQRRARRK
jgi:hypothetical protein